MKSTGIVRKIDELGRIVIPKEIRNVLGIHSNDDLEIFIDDMKIVLTKYEKSDNILNYSNNIVKIIATACLYFWLNKAILFIFMWG